jgi:hypothetical protein
MPINLQRRHPKVGAAPAERQIKTGGDPESFDKETIAWQFHRMDVDHQHWGWNLPANQWREILKSLKVFEGLTWAKLKETSGGRRHGTNHHSLGIEELSINAKNRIVELGLEQYDKIFSLRMAATLRLYGIREGRVMRLIWRDPHHHHGSRNCVWPYNG